MQRQRRVGAGAQSTSRSRSSGVAQKEVQAGDDRRSEMWSASSMTSTTGRGLAAMSSPDVAPGSRGWLPRDERRQSESGTPAPECLDDVVPERGRVVVEVVQGQPRDRPRRPLALHPRGREHGLPEPAGPLRRVSGDRCTSRVSIPIRRWRSTVACAGSGGTSFDATRARPCRSSGGPPAPDGAAVPAVDSRAMFPPDGAPRCASACPLHPTPFRRAAPACRIVTHRSGSKVTAQACLRTMELTPEG